MRESLAEARGDQVNAAIDEATYQVHDRSGFVRAYAREPFGAYTLERVVSELTRDGDDAVIWHGRRLVAAVRYGRYGEPISMIF
jgi:hypothetical protein